MLRCLAGHRDGGQDVVEYALVLPLLLLLLFGIVEVSLAVWYHDTLSNIAREVARCGIIYANSGDIPGECLEPSQDHFGTGFEPDRLTIVPTLGGDTIKVVATYDYQPLTGLIFGATITLHSESTMRNEY